MGGFVTATQRVPWSGIGVRRLTDNPDRYRLAAAAKREKSVPPPVAPAPNEGELAWQLATVVTDHLNRAIRSRIYLLLGCGDHHDAIIHLLEQVKAREIELPATLQEQIETWVAGYRGTTVEPSLRALVSPISTAKHQLSEPASASHDAASTAPCAAPTDVVTAR